MISIILPTFVFTLFAVANGDACSSTVTWVKCTGPTYYTADQWGMGFGGLRADGCTDAPMGGACCGGDCCSDYNGKWINGPSAEELIGTYFLHEWENCAGRGRAISCDGNNAPPEPWENRLENNPTPTWKYENTFSTTDPTGSGDWVLEMIKPAKTDAQKAVEIAHLLFAFGKPIIGMAGPAGKVAKGVIGGALEYASIKAKEGAPAMAVDLASAVKRLDTINKLNDVKVAIKQNLANIEAEMKNVLSFKSDVKSDTVLQVIQAKVSTRSTKFAEEYQSSFLNAWLDPESGGAPEAAFFLFQPMFAMFSTNFELRKLQFITSMAMVGEEETEAKMIEWTQQACNDVNDYMYGGSAGPTNIASFPYQWNQFVKYLKTALKARTDAVTQPTCYGSSVSSQQAAWPGFTTYNQHFDAGETWTDTWEYAAVGTELPTYSVGWKAVGSWKGGNAFECKSCKLEYTGQAIPDKASFDAFMTEQRDAYVGQIENLFAGYFEKYLASKTAMWKFLRTTEMICERSLDENWRNSNHPEQFCMKIEPQEFISTPEGSSKLGIHENQWSSTARVNLFDLEKADFGYVEDVDQSDCTYLQDFYYIGGDIPSQDKRINGVSTAFSCKSLCDQDEHCQRWSFHFQGSCFLRSYSSDNKALTAVLTPLKTDGYNAVGWTSGKGLEDQCTAFGGRRYSPWYFTALPVGRTCPTKKIISSQEKHNLMRVRWTKQTGTGVTKQTSHVFEWNARGFTNSWFIWSDLAPNNAKDLAEFPSPSSETGADARSMILLKPGVYQVTNSEGQNDSNDAVNVDLKTEAGTVLVSLAAGVAHWSGWKSSGYSSFVIETPTYVRPVFSNNYTAYNTRCRIDFLYSSPPPPVGTVTYDEWGWEAAATEFLATVGNPDGAQVFNRAQHLETLSSTCGSDRDAFRRECEAMCLLDDNCGGYMIESESFHANVCECVLTDMTCQNDAFSPGPKLSEGEEMPLTAEYTAYQRGHRGISFNAHVYSPLPASHRCPNNARIPYSYWDHTNLAGNWDTSNIHATFNLFGIPCASDWTIMSARDCQAAFDRFQPWVAGTNEGDKIIQIDSTTAPAGCYVKGGKPYLNKAESSVSDETKTNVNFCAPPGATTWFKDSDPVKASLHASCESHTQADRDHIVELCQDKCDQTVGCTGFSVATDDLWNGDGCLCVLYEGSEACDVRDFNPNYQTFMLRPDEIMQAPSASSFAYGGVRAEAVEILGGTPGNLEVRYEGAASFRTDFLALDPPTLTKVGDAYSVDNNMGLTALVTPAYGAGGGKLAPNYWTYKFQSDDKYICPKGKPSTARRLERASSSLAERLEGNSI